MKKYNKYVLALTLLSAMASVSADDSSGSDVLDMRDMKIDDYVAQSLTTKSAISQGLDAAQAEKRTITADCKQSQKEIDTRIENLKKELRKTKTKKAKTPTKTSSKTRSKKASTKKTPTKKATKEAYVDTIA